MPDITAKINVNTSAGPQKFQPYSAQAGRNNTLQLKLLSDVDTTELNDGALLQYRNSDGKVCNQNGDSNHCFGTLLFNCGNF